MNWTNKLLLPRHATQTKHHRTRTFDLYNLSLCAAAAEGAAGAYGMPALPPAPADAEPEKLVPFNVAMRLNRVPERRGGGGLLMTENG